MQHLLTTVLKLHEDGALPGDLRVTNNALKELRYAYKVFAPYRAVRKVTVFGSARTPPTDDSAGAAREFGRRMVQEGWMVITGAGRRDHGRRAGGRGGEQSFGLNIRLPFEQDANPWIASDPKLITFKYFFTRKLFLVKEASAVVLFPGGFGTMDEGFELMTLMQTGKSPIVPVVLCESGPSPTGASGTASCRGRWSSAVLIDRRTPGSTASSTAPRTRVREVTDFYRVYHSSRIVGDDLVFRLTRPLTDDNLKDIQHRFEDLLKGPLDQSPGPLPLEQSELPALPRLIVPFNRSSYARLRRLIDYINTL